MKKIISILIMVLAVALSLTSCLKEDNVKDPVVTGHEMFMTALDGKDSLITEIFHGKEIKIVVYTGADMVAIWPGAIREVMKKNNSTVDSVDMFNHDVLVVSDYFSDYGLVKARGLSTTLTEGGWYAFYTYPEAGDFDLIVVATNHGYNGPDLRRIIHDAGNVTVK
jgi:putative cell wall-binding protein